MQDKLKNGFDSELFRTETDACQVLELEGMVHHLCLDRHVMLVEKHSVQPDFCPKVDGCIDIFRSVQLSDTCVERLQPRAFPGTGLNKDHVRLIDREPKRL